MAKITPFERHALEYEGWFERNKYVYQSEVRAVKKLIPPRGQGIEIGVGSARFSTPFGIKYGIEPSFEMGRYAINKGVKVINGIAENLPLKNEQFNYVLMVTTVCFLDDLDKAFHEVYRILKNNGCIVIGFVDKESMIGKLYQKNKNKSMFYKEANFYSVAEIISYLIKNNFMDFHYCQTIFRTLADIKKLEPVKEGYGLGSFVVIRAKKYII